MRCQCHYCHRGGRTKGIPSQKTARIPTQRSSHLVWVMGRNLLIQGTRSLEASSRSAQRPGDSGSDEQKSTHKVRNMRSVTIAANTASGTNITGTHI